MSIDHFVPRNKLSHKRALQVQKLRVYSSSPDSDSERLFPKAEWVIGTIDNRYRGIMYWILLPLRRYADFKGRSRRMEYFVFHIFIGLIFATCGGVLFALAPAMSTWHLKVWIGLMSVALGLLALPILALEVRRFQDLNRSGWFVLLNLVPVLGRLIVLLFMIRKGTNGTNRYGDDPVVN